MKSIRSKFVRNYIFKNLKFYRSSSLSQPLEGFKNNFIKSQSLQYTQKTLDNGCDVLIETPTLPGYISFIICIKGGVSYENQQNSGYFQWLANSIQNYLLDYPHILINTETEVKEDCFILQSCLISDKVEEYLQVFGQCFQQDILQDGVLQDMQYNQDFQNDVLKTVLQVSYDNKGLGKPTQGLQINYENRDQLSQQGRQLHQQILKSHNVKFFVSGVYNQEKFLEILNKNFQHIQNEQIDIQLEESIFKAQHQKQDRVEQKLDFHSDYDMSAYQVALAFPLKNELLENSMANQLLARIIGECSYFISSGPGKGVYLLSKYILNNCHPSTHTGNIYHQWENQGLMGIYIKAINNQNNIVLQYLQEMLGQLSKFPNNRQFHEYFNRAKNILKREIISDSEMQQDRMFNICQKVIRNQQYKQTQIIEALDQITFDQVKERSIKIFNQNPAISEISSNQIRHQTLKQNQYINNLNAKFSFAFSYFTRKQQLKHLIAFNFLLRQGFDISSRFKKQNVMYVQLSSQQFLKCIRNRTCINLRLIFVEKIMFCVFLLLLMSNSQIM